MVDSSRPSSRSGRSTRAHPAPPEPPITAADRPATVGKAARTNTHAPSNEAPRPATRSHKLEPLQLNGVNTKTVLKAENNVAGRKRTRGQAAAADEDHEKATGTTKQENAVAQKHGPVKPQTANGIHSRHKSPKETINGVGVAAQKQNGVPTAPAARQTAPTNGESSQDKRTLRSQDNSSRIKSELSIYFPNYDDIINDAPQEPEFLLPETPIVVVDEPLKSSNDEAHSNLTLRNKRGSIDKSFLKNNTSKHSRRTSVNGPATSAFASASNPGPLQLNGAQSLDLSSLTRKLSSASSSTSPQPDPLPDTLYFKAHRRAERKEKQLRNIEKERAQHEKVQLEGLLEGLQGPDWLKVMGITAITDGEKKEWEGKRAHFIKEVDALLEKFKLWKDEEKRLKVEREEKRLAEEEEEEDEEDEGEAEDEGDEVEDDVESTGPNSSDLDASAARQLQLEASSAIKRTPKPKPAEVKKPPPDVPFTTFYAKPHLRAQALGKQRHGRSELAFGKPHPNYPDTEFTLPDEYTSPEALKSHARKRRRLKREVTDASADTEKGKGKA